MNLVFGSRQKYKTCFAYFPVNKTGLVKSAGPLTRSFFGGEWGWGSTIFMTKHNKTILGSILYLRVLS